LQFDVHFNGFLAQASSSGRDSKERKTKGKIFLVASC
jgi:hypothetical protein